MQNCSLSISRAEWLRSQASYPAGVIASTADNLKAAAEGEKLEWGTLYPNFGEVAEKEGLMMLLQLFVWLLKSKSTMNADTTSCWRVCSRAKSSRRMRRLSGNAETAVSIRRTQWHLINAQHVLIRKRTLKSGQKTTNRLFALGRLYPPFI